MNDIKEVNDAYPKFGLHCIYQFTRAKQVCDQQFYYTEDYHYTLGIGEDDDDGPSSKRAKSDSPNNMTPTPPGGVGGSGVGLPGMANSMMAPGAVGSLPGAPFGITG